MTKITAKENENGFEAEIRGHTEKAVCGAISTLTAAFEGWLLNNCRKYEYTEADGYCKIKAPPEARTAFEVFIIGCLRLEKNFPEMLRVECR